MPISTSAERPCTLGLAAVQASCRDLCSTTPACSAVLAAAPLTTPACRGLIQATLHMVNREFDLLADDFITLGMLPSGSDMNAIVPALTQLFSKALAKGVSNIRSAHCPHAAAALAARAVVQGVHMVCLPSDLRKACQSGLRHGRVATHPTSIPAGCDPAKLDRGCAGSFGEMSNDLGRTMYEYQFRIPPYYTLLVRSLSVLEVRCLPGLPALSMAPVDVAAGIGSRCKHHSCMMPCGVWPGFHN